MKVKIVELYVKELLYQEDYDYHTSTFYFPADSNDWEDITEEEYQHLKNWADQENRRHNDKKYVLAIETDLSPKLKAKDLIEAQRKALQQQEKARKNRDKVDAAEALKRKQKRFEKLKAELGK